MAPKATESASSSTGRLPCVFSTARSEADHAQSVARGSVARIVVGGADPIDIDRLLQQFQKTRVLVLGDMVADEYITGRPQDISREAPVLVLQYVETHVRPGGATNTACNLSSLGAQTHVVGVVGDDEMGHALRSELDGFGISTAGLIVDPARPTSTKTRILGKGTQEVQQQIVRIDRVDRSVIDGDLRAAMIEKIEAMLPRVDALVVSDYENGVISQEVLDQCLPQARALGIVVIVDSHGDLFRFKGVTAATPNQPEAEATLGTLIQNDVDLAHAGDALLRGMDAEGVLITRGSEGVALFEPNVPVYCLTAPVTADRDVIDPTGAGDTVAAVFTLGLCAGATMQQAACMSNVAGGEVARKLGPATLSLSQLAAALEPAAKPADENGSRKR